MGGVLPFGCIFIQLFFILNSLWSNQMYYMFGFLFLVFIILVITCSETTVLLCYFHLCAEVCLNISIREMFKNLNISYFTGLSLVVAQLFDKRFYSLLLVPLLRPLFCHKIGNSRCHIYFPVLRIHFHHGFHVLPSFR